MPELPEVETIVNGLRSKISPGTKIESFAWYDHRPFGGVDPQSISEELIGTNIDNIFRYGKYLQFELSHGSVIVAHLRMTGKFVYLDKPDKESDKHLRYEFGFANNHSLQYIDPRRFGTFVLYNKDEPIREIAKLGPDALLDEDLFKRLSDTAHKSPSPIKSFLLDQSKVAGLGNIYVCEALFRANIHPSTSAKLIPDGKLKNLVNEIKIVLREAIKHNGTSISDFRSVDDKTGAFQNFLRVYGKENEPCSVCNKKILRFKIAGRSTFACSNCQPL